MPQNQSMEDTPKLTQIAAEDLEQAELLEDFFRGYEWTTDKQLRWKKMQAEVFGWEKRNAA
jgi:hypothetical protein